MAIDIPVAAHKKAAEVFTIISQPAAVHVIQCILKEGEASSREMEGTFNINQIRKTTAKLIKIGVLRKESTGTDVYYKLVHVRLETINAAAARIL
jgi:transcription initiation factor IIE alpha subunit